MMDTNDDDGSGYNLDDVPSYEDMIEKALTAIGDPRGSSPRSIWEWMGRSVAKDLFTFVTKLCRYTSIIANIF